MRPYVNTIEHEMRVTIVVAVADNGVIGKDGEMPWHYPDDLAHFEAVTMDCPVILGRITFETITDRLGEPLPGRTNVVLTRNPDHVNSSDPATRVATTVDEALEIARQTGSSELFVAGGASVYEQFLPIADRLVMTEIHEQYEGGTTFPDWDRDEWREIERDDREQLSFVVYERESGD